MEQLQTDFNAAMVAFNELYQAAQTAGVLPQILTPFQVANGAFQTVAADISRLQQFASHK